VLKGLAAFGAAAALGPFAGCSSDSDGNQTGPVQTTTSARITPPTPLQSPGTRPDPSRPEGVDTFPQIEHIILLMMENHSFDDHFGMLGRGDGFRLDDAGRPRDANPDGSGSFIRAFRMPSGCQLRAVPSQAWNASHTAWNGGRNDGFVRASGAVAMGYWTGDDIPFYYGLGRTFPLCDRFFCSVLAQTYPNRRFLLAGTAAGIVSTTNEALVAPPPPNGTIIDRFAQHGITWKNYYSNLPAVGVIPQHLSNHPANFVNISEYFTDAQRGTLPSVSFVDPHFSISSEENPQDIRFGEQFSAQVINAAMHGPAWPKTLLVWFYDEHGGYCDHVPPPRAVKPDDIPPSITVPPDLPGAYDRYGFRVPAVIVSPYARRNYVSHHVHDITSVLRLIETKWNLAALTYRDANATELLDTLDLRGRPRFLDPPELPEPAFVRGAATCVPGDPGGPIPPDDAVVPADKRDSVIVGAT
jgi:phospholipase C